LLQGTALIVGVNEILKWLVGAGVLAAADYHDGLLRLRAADVRFLPLEADEILHHLRQAAVEDGAVVETRALVILRRSAARSVLQARDLQCPPLPDGAPNPQGEVAYVVGYVRAVGEAIAEAWRNTPEAIAQARAEWLLDNLFVDDLAMRRAMTIARGQEDARYVVAVSLAGLIGCGIGLPTRQPEAGPTSRRRYLGWLDRAVL
jgi:hypothetical protein